MVRQCCLLSLALLPCCALGLAIDLRSNAHEQRPIDSPIPPSLEPLYPKFLTKSTSGIELSPVMRLGIRQATTSVTTTTSSTTSVTSSSTRTTSSSSSASGSSSSSVSASGSTTASNASSTTVASSTSASSTSSSATSSSASASATQSGTTMSADSSIGVGGIIGIVIGVLVGCSLLSILFTAARKKRHAARKRPRASLYDPAAFTAPKSAGGHRSNDSTTFTPLLNLNQPSDEREASPPSGSSRRASREEHIEGDQTEERHSAHEPEPSEPSWLGHDSFPSPYDESHELQPPTPIYSPAPHLGYAPLDVAHSEFSEETIRSAMSSRAQSEVGYHIPQSSPPPPTGTR